MRLSLRLSGALLILLPAMPAFTQNLPRPCSPGTCGSGPDVFVSEGRANTVVVGDSSLTIEQLTDRAIFNWQSFNIGPDASVEFVQPDITSVALNRIFDASPSRIAGALTANGQVYLLNANGVIFTPTATVDVGSLLASSFDIDDEVFLSVGISQAIRSGNPALTGDAERGAVIVEDGAEIGIKDGGRVLLFAPTIETDGTITAPDGQIIMAASEDTVYLDVSGSSDLRGLIVEVGTGGLVRNGGSITAPRGNVTLMGATINQQGLVAATTSVSANGSVRLLAQDGAFVNQLGGFSVDATSTGELIVDEGAIVAVLPEDDPDGTAVDEQLQAASSIELLGRTIEIRREAQIVATGGEISALAVQDPRFVGGDAVPRNDSRLSVAAGAIIDASGDTSAIIPMERNSLEFELRGNELADAPLQRDGVLRGAPVSVDVRRGTPLADTAPIADGIERTVNERLSPGGEITLLSEGETFLETGSVIDVSGGSIRYEDGFVASTLLAFDDGRLVDISDADPDVIYAGIADVFVKTYDRWGVAETFMNSAPGAALRPEAGYVEGKDAGSISIRGADVVLGANLIAGVIRGRYQRQLADPLAAGAAWTRPFDQVPVSGSLSIDVRPDVSVIRNVDLVDRVAPTSDLPELLPPDRTLELDASALSASGLGEVLVRTNGTFTSTADSSLVLADGGGFAVTSDNITLAGDIDVAGGDVTLTAETDVNFMTDIVLEEGASIDVSGTWVNDNPQLGDSLAPVVVAGGSVSLESTQNISIDEGAAIRADGGAWLDENQTLTAGSGGAISLIPRGPDTNNLFLGGELSAFALTSGGSLTVSANDVYVSNTPDESDALQLTPEFFSRGGFQTYSINANNARLEIAPGTEILAQQRNFQLADGFDLVRSTRSVGSLATTNLLPDEERNASSLSFALQQIGRVGSTLENFVVGRGSVLEVDPGGSLNLVSDGNLIVDGTLRAPSGEIALEVAVPSAGFAPYRPEQGLWLDSNARLDVSASFIPVPNDDGFRDGILRDAGSVSLTARRGFIVTNPGSSIVADGLSTVLDLPLNSLTELEPVNVAAAAGSVAFAAAEAMSLSGDISARAAADVEGAAAGFLSVTLDTSLRGINNLDDLQLGGFSVTPRRVGLTTTTLPRTIGPGQVLPEALDDRVDVSAELVTGSGVDDLTLDAENVIDTSTRQVLAVSRIEATSDVDLTLRGNLRLLTSDFDIAGRRVSLGASTVQLGQTSIQAQPVVTAAEALSGSLDLNASLIELIGNVTVSGAANTRLLGEEDIRFRGVRTVIGEALEGQFASFGAAEFSAGRLYPTTFTRYALTVAGEDSSLLFSGSGTAIDAPPLSAGGVLSASASRIDVDGARLLAPLGQLSLNAETTLTVGSGSVISSSLDGSLVPLGRTQGGFDWTYSPDPALTFVLETPPAQTIALAANDIDIAEGAVIDFSGGGDVYASEFVPGPGGSTDVLNPANNGLSFAIVPTLGGSFAPFDPAESTDPDIALGQTVVLQAVPEIGLVAGEYAVLPATYALLPGAFLITPQANGDFPVGASVDLPAGGFVVAGRFGRAGSDVVESRWSGFAVETGTIALTRSEITLTPATEFFSDSNSRLPVDAGTLELTAESGLTIDGTVDSAPAEGGLGSVVSISSSDILLSSSDVAEDGQLRLDPADLQSLGTASLIIGGTRTLDVATGVAALSPFASRVEVAGDVRLDLNELVLLAGEDIEVQSGAVLASTSGENVQNALAYTTEGDGALVRVSSGQLTSVSRSNQTGLTGNVSIADGVELTAPGGSVNIDGTATVEIDGTLDVVGGALEIGAPAIALTGDPNQAPDATLVLDPQVLTGLGLDLLSLRSPSDILLGGDSSLEVANLSVVSSGIAGTGATGQLASLTATTVSFGGGGSAPAAGVATGQGSLSITADTVALTDGAFRLAGFDQATLSAGTLLLDGEGSLTTGALDVRTDIVTSSAGAVFAIDAADAPVSFARLGGAPAAGIATGLAGQLAIEAASIDLATEILLPSGRLSLTASNGDVRLGSDALVDLSGTSVVFGDQVTNTPGGAFAASALNGDVRLAGGSTVDVSGLDAAGTVALSALAGALIVDGALQGESAGGSSQSGSIAAAARNFGQLDNFLTSIAAGGFRRSIDLRQTGAVDLTIGADSAVTAENILIAADRGAVQVDGLVEGAADGASVSIAARDAIRVSSTGQIRTTGDSTVDLTVARGDGVVSASGESLDIGGADINVTLAEGEPVAGRVDLTDLSASAPANFTVEVVRTYNEDDGVVDAADIARYREYLTDFENNVLPDRDAIESAAGIATNLRPGIEVRSDGDLDLNARWDLIDWRVGDDPGRLLVRAAGSLSVNADLSDAVTEDNTSLLRPSTILDTGESWSLGLVAGADLSAARRTATTLTEADLLLAPGIVVRTGTGSIDLAAARDVSLADTSTRVYTAGRSTGQGTLPSDFSDFFLLRSHYPEDGGDIRIAAGRDILGAPYENLVAEWLFRLGPVGDLQIPTVTSIYLNAFEQGVGALGGGSIVATAGRDIVDLGASVPRTRQHTGVIEFVSGQPVLIDNSFVTRGGGDIVVTAGRDVLGGRFYGEGGVIAVTAGRDMGASPEGTLAPVVLPSDSTVALRSSGDLVLQNVLSPYILPFGATQVNLFVPQSPVFFNYAPTDSVLVESIAGDITVVNNTLRLFQQTNLQLPPTIQPAASVYPGTFDAVAYSGSVNFDGALTLYPVADGGFQVYAFENIGSAGTGAPSLIQPDGDFRLLPTVAEPVGLIEFAGETLRLLSPDAHGAVPNHIDDQTPSRFIAQTGSIQTNASFSVVAAEPVEVTAGENILNLLLVAQNIRDRDQSIVTAGEDITYSIGRTRTGAISSNSSRIEIGGPGQIVVLAGDEIDLGSSAGILTRGDQANPALADSGANITIITGLNQGSDFAAFREAYVEESDKYAEDLVAYLSELLPDENVTDANAVPLFLALDDQEQQPFLIDVLFGELREAGEAGAREGVQEAYDPGFEAIEILFPPLEEDVVSGDVSLFFSQIQTLDGGDITILAPRGNVNAGLAATLAGAKPASELGIVAQRDGDVRSLVDRDFLVNQSRVFTLDGGSILIWSSKGDIDAGRGAKSALSAPPPQVSVDQNGNVIVEFPPAIAGSGIRAAVSTAGRDPGSVFLFAPAGVVSAGDAGIGSAGDVIIGATEVIGADNIDVGGVAIGVPVDTGGLAAGLVGVSNTAQEAARAATSATTGGEQDDEDTPEANRALGFLEVFILGFGEEDDDEET